MSSLTKYEARKEELNYFQTLANIAQKGSSSGLSPVALMNIMLTAKDLGISPMKAVNGGFYIVNNKICMSTALMADRIRKDGHSIKIPEWTKDKCVIIGVRKDNGDSIKVEYTLEDAALAGLLNSPTWKKFPKHMLYNRAMSTLARVLFSDVVGNAYSEDERWDIQNTPIPNRPTEDPCDELTVEMTPSVVMAQTPIEKPPKPPEVMEESTEIELYEEPMEAEPLQALRNHLVSENLSVDKLEEFLEKIAARQNKTVAEAVVGALIPDLLPRFTKAYSNYLHAARQEN